MSRYSYEFSKGRHKGKKRTYVEPLLTIVEIASKYDLDPCLLVESFTEAWKNQSDHCGGLKITCRGVNKEDSAIFLVTCEETVVSQFSI